MQLTKGAGPLGLSVSRGELASDIAKALIFVGSDTAGNIGNSAAETPVANFTIPANTVITKIVIIAAIRWQQGANSSTQCTFRVKTGALGSETTKHTQIIKADAAAGNTSAMQGGSLVYDENSLTWTAQQSVVITAQNSAASATQIAYCEGLLIVGY